jgi:hypothetical protein
MAMAVATSAQAADSVYWTNVSGLSALSWAAVDSSAAGNVTIPGLSIVAPRALTIDPASGRAYLNDHAGATFFVKLDGSGGGEVPTPGLTHARRYGLALDSAAGRLYTDDPVASKILFANVDGSGGGPVVTSGATVAAPWGVAVDPAAGRVYWANHGAPKISFANVNGTGGGDINTTGATVAGASGIAVDPAAGRVYWSSSDILQNRISFANLDGTGGADLNTTGATVSSPIGLAIDHAAGRIYWINEGTSTVSFARLDGSGGGNLPTLAATIYTPWSISLLKTPQSTAPPTISGSTKTGSTLTCSEGTWAPDVTASFLFQAPQTVTYAWKRDTKTISGATSKTLRASQAGAYTCLVTATNQSGSAQALSAPVTVVTPPAGSSNTPPPATNTGSSTPPATPQQAKIQFVLARRGVAVLSISTPGKVLLRSGAKVKAASRTFTHSGAVTIRWKLTKKARRTLHRKHHLTVVLTAKLTPSDGAKPVRTAKTIRLKR